MCGICGYLHFDRSKRPSEDVLRSMMATIEHRGPDDHGVYIKDNAALGHRRLSIIDLRTGHQPMTNEDGTLAIAYNGEVYNFRELREDLAKKGYVFKTSSDTEVVLRSYEEYGEECVGRFNGMFALAIWDARRGKLFLARDRFGKKPLYYAAFDNQFIFASELKALLKHPSVRREIDPASVSRYLAYEYVPSPYSIFRGVFKLEAGCKISVEGGSYRVDRYWDLEPRPDMSLDAKAAEERLIDLLKRSVRRRLISDVPLGVFLSGGIDSSAVVAMMADLMSPKEIKTFSIGFREASFDESSDARCVAEHFGTDHHEEILSPRTMLEVFPKICAVLDEPFADSSIIPTYLVSSFTRKDVTVALGGDGGDEFFLGYQSFLAHQLDGISRFVPRSIKRGALGLALKCFSVSNEYMSFSLKARRFLKGLDYADNVRHQVWIGSFHPREQEGLLAEAYRPRTPSEVYATTAAYYDRARSLSPLNRALYLYVKTYMTDDILAKVDRASMANSLEVRAPFLDNELTGFAATIPPSMKLRNFRTKWIFRSALKGRLPDRILNKKKQGFAVPVAQWLKEDLRPLLLDAFEKRKIEAQGIFDYKAVEALVRQFLADKADTRKEIWALFMFQMWYDKWMRRS